MNTLRTLAIVALAALPACKEGKSTKYWLDKDMDGHGTNTKSYNFPGMTCATDKVPAYSNVVDREPEAFCATQEEIKRGVLSALALRSGDCNDNNAEIKPGAEETIDGQDNNCDGLMEMNTAPEGQDQLYEKFSVDGRPTFANNPTPWEEILTEFGRTIAQGTLAPRAAYGFKPNTTFLKDPQAQDRLYAWALPSLQHTVGSASPANRAYLHEELEAAASYASTMDVEAETTYLRNLQARDCSDLYRHVPAWLEETQTTQGLPGDPDYRTTSITKNTATCEQFFVYYGPNAPWKKAIAQARARGETTKEKYDDIYEPFIFIDEPKFTEHRHLQARIYRRVANGEITKENLQKWIEKIRTDLKSALSVVEQ